MNNYDLIRKYVSVNGDIQEVKRINDIMNIIKWIIPGLFSAYFIYNLFFLNILHFNFVAEIKFLTIMNKDNLVVTLSTQELKDLVYDAVKDALDNERKQQEEKANEKYLTRQDVMNLLKISKVTLWKLDKTNVLERKRIGRKVLYTKSSVLAAQTSKL